MSSRAETPDWAFWGHPEPALPVRHAVRILSKAAALEELVHAGGPPLDRALRAYQAGQRAMGRSDRLVLGTAVYALARSRELHRAAQPDAVPGDGRRLVLAFLDARAGSPGEVPGLPDGPRPWEERLLRLAALRQEWAAAIAAAAAAPPAEAPLAALEAAAALFSVPRWWLTTGPWPTLDAAARELARLKLPQSLALRVQAHRMAPDDARARLAALGVPVRRTVRSPWGLVVAGRHNVLATELHREGLVEVQDEGSQLIACACDPKPGEKVLDYCAGGGGKTLALAAAMGGRGAVAAYDVDARRLADTRQRATRAGLDNVRVFGAAAAVARGGPYDLVLVDAPCSSSGTLRRNPDVAWRWTEADLERLVALQAEILDRAAALVRPGGTLVYATCSLLDPENSAQVAAFLARNPAWVLAPFGDRKAHAPFADVPGAAEGACRLPANLPDYEGDAFFVARFRRGEEQPAGRQLGEPESQGEAGSER